MAILSNGFKEVRRKTSIVPSKEFKTTGPELHNANLRQRAWISIIKLVVRLEKRVMLHLFERKMIFEK
jgi:hypothetical protein